MEQPSPSPIDDLSLDALRSLVKELVTKLAEQDAEIKALKEEITRLKGHKGRAQAEAVGHGTGDGEAVAAPRRQEEGLEAEPPEYGGQ